MMQEVSSESVIVALKQALSQRLLPVKAAETAERFIERLASPVRITLMGPPGAGKSALRDLLVGQGVVSGDIWLPTSSLRYGETERVRATMADGSRLEFEGLDIASLRPLSPAYVELFAPLPVLKKISLLEVVTNGSVKDQLAAAGWAARRTDIAIWVTPAFDADQQKLWRVMPDRMQNHAFMVLSKVDRLPPETRAAALRIQHDMAREDFLGVFPIAGMHAVAVRQSPSRAEAGAVKVTGAKPLIDELMRRVDLGHQADVDGALLFLNRFKDALPAFDTAASDVQQPVSASSPAAAPARPGSEIALAAGAGVADRVPEVLPPDDDSALHHQQQQLLEHIRSSAHGILRRLRDAQQDPSDIVLARCADTVSELCGIITDQNPLRNTTAEAVDVIILLQLERDKRAAEDAAVALLQLKRCFEAALAV